MHELAVACIVPLPSNEIHAGLKGPSSTQRPARPTRRNWIRAGWEALHEAVVLREAVTDDSGQRVLDTNGYLSLLNPLADAAGLRAQLNPEPGYAAIRSASRAEDAAVWRELSEAMSWAEAVQQASEGCQSLAKTEAPVRNPQNPRSLALFGRWMTRQEWNSKSRWERWLAGLVYIGCGWTQMAEAQYCKYCFRRAWPGRALCEEHSQSGVEAPARGEVLANVALAKRIQTAAARAGDVFGSFPEAELKMYRDASLVELLCPLFPDRDDDDVEMHRFLLASSLRTLHLVGNDALTLDAAELRKRLRQRIDPHEWFEAVWPSKILICEKWLEWEALVVSGAADNAGNARREVTAFLRTLIAAGTTQADIARRLGVSRSTVNKWLKRR